MKAYLGLASEPAEVIRLAADRVTLKSSRGYAPGLRMVVEFVNPAHTFTPTASCVSALDSGLRMALPLKESYPRRFWTTNCGFWSVNGRGLAAPCPPSSLGRDSVTSGWRAWGAGESIEKLPLVRTSKDQACSASLPLMGVSRTGCHPCCKRNARSLPFCASCRGSVLPSLRTMTLRYCLMMFRRVERTHPTQSTRLYFMPAQPKLCEDVVKVGLGTV
jgi:hypothetical protein